MVDSVVVKHAEGHMIPCIDEWVEARRTRTAPQLGRYTPCEPFDGWFPPPPAGRQWTTLALAMLLLIGGIFTSAPSAQADVRTARYVKPRPRRPVRVNAPRSVATPPSQAAKTFDPCSIIPPRFAAAALGADPGPGAATTVPNGGQCSYGNDVGAIIVSIVRGPSALGKTAKDAVNNGIAKTLAGTAENQNPDVIFNTLTGIGEGAFVIGTGSSPDKGFTSASLTFYTGDTYVSILLSFHPATQNPVTQITALARSVAPLVPR